MLKNFAVRLLVSLTVIGVLAAGAAWWGYYRSVNEPLQFGKGVFKISKGETLNGIANRLVRKGTVREPWSLRLLAKQEGKGSNIKAGEYRFPEGINLREFLDRIVTGRGQVDVRVTILEGWTFRQMRDALAGADKLIHETRDWSDEQIMEALGSPGKHPEGWFYPDTYYYRADDTDLAILRKSHERMKKKLAAAWDERDADLPLDDPYEVLVMASIIEKESWVGEEQPTIAGVFFNRLAKGMRLQTDPTVIYGIGNEFDGNITRDHLKTDTPYNTYTRYGLTPTPISLPGENALKAVVQPHETDAYYFVAKGEGRHQFSRTLAEHNRAVKKFLLDRAQ